jgi:hypothetical protein
VTKITQVALRKRCDHPVNKQHARLRIRADITVAEAAAAALEVAAVAASAASQLSPFEPPQQEERTSPADDAAGRT